MPHCDAAPGSTRPGRRPTPSDCRLSTVAYRHCPCPLVPSSTSLRRPWLRLFSPLPAHSAEAFPSYRIPIHFRHHYFRTIRYDAVQYGIIRCCTEVMVPEVDRYTV
eukprot:6196509-Pleurochrysis_carterae.AAC.1